MSVRKLRRPLDVQRLALGQLIEEALLSKGISQVTLARWMKVTSSAVNQWLSGDAAPSHRRRIELGKILEIPPEKMLQDVTGIDALLKQKEASPMDQRVPVFLTHREIYAILQLFDSLARLVDKGKADLFGNVSVELTKSLKAVSGHDR